MLTRGREARFRALPQLTVDVANFLDNLPEDAPSFSPGVAAALRGMLTLRSVEEIINDRGLRHPYITMVRGDAEIPAMAYTNAGVPGYRGNYPKNVNAPLLARQFSSGATIILQDLLSCWRPVTDFCRRLSYELARPASCAAFLTPAGERGFRHHYDVYSSFAVQLHGRKTWELYRPARKLPLEVPDQAWTGERALSADDRQRIAGAPDMTVELTAGDALWVPRGWIHNVFATGELSLHLTIHLHGLPEYAFVDPIRNMLRDDEGFRRSLPLDFPLSTEAAKSAAEEFLARLGDRIRDADPGQLASAVIDRVRASWYPPRCQPFTEMLLTEEELHGYDGLIPVREAVLTADRMPTGCLRIDTGHREVVLDPAAAELFQAPLAADDGQLIPLRQVREALGGKALEVIRLLVGSGVATLAKADDPR